MRRHHAADILLIFIGAFVLFATTITHFEARVTDISAWRVLNGDVPYRDFWTIYAPGSYSVLALVFAVVGRQLLVSNLLGVAVSAAAVALCYRLARLACPGWAATCVSAIVAAAFYESGYHDGFASYPPALALLLTGVALAVARADRPGSRWAIAPGVWLGLAVLFKHDVAGYAIIAACLGLVVARRGEGYQPALALVAAASAIVIPVLLLLLAMGAGPDLWKDLVAFPLTDFRHVRTQGFPLLPRFSTSLVGSAEAIIEWTVFNGPTIALLAGALGLWNRRRTLGPQGVMVATVACAGFLLHWTAAHVQLNTNAVSLPLWGALVGALGLSPGAEPWKRLVMTAAVSVWALLLLTVPAYRLVQELPGGREWVGLPHLRGISAARGDVGWMRDLAATMADADAGDVPLLFVAARNDLDIFASTTPFWLTDRHPATRHHELHPGITDTEAIQRQMIARLDQRPLPVVVREHRFSDEELDRTKSETQRHVAVGSTLLDVWIADRYESGASSGMYEVMRRRRP